MPGERESPRGCALPSPNTNAVRGRYGGLKSWANTVDRSARTAPGRSSGPASIEYHLDRLPDKFADASDAQKLAAATAARSAYYARLALKSAEARRRRKGAA